MQIWLFVYFQQKLFIFVTNKMKNETKENMEEKEHEDEGGENDLVNLNHLFVLKVIHILKHHLRSEPILKSFILSKIRSLMLKGRDTS